jgi:uncharacterized protein (TIGR03382 family)
MRTALAIAVAVFTAATARADVTRCANGDGAVAYSVADLTAQSGDTGWFPSDPTAQLRLTGEIVGKTAVNMGLSPTACWDTGMIVSTPGEARTGMLDVEYGAALHLYGQVHTSVLGESIDWSGEIPIPFVPTDLLLAGTTAFDPMLLPDSPVQSASVSDTTDPVTVLSTNVLSDIIDIIGISGNLYVTVQGAMTTTYTTSSVAIGDDGVITSATGGASLDAPAGGYGPTLSVSASATGNVHYAPSLVFAANADISILGYKIVNYQIASITMPLSPIDRPISLTGTGAQIGLPHIDTLPQQLGFASGSTQMLQLHNGGAAPLMIEQSSAPDGVTAEAVTIAPGTDGVVSVTAADVTAIGNAPLILSTNDPNQPSVTVALAAAASGQTNTPSPTDDGGDHAGCNAAGSSPGAMLFIVIALMIRRRRRR